MIMPDVTQAITVPAWFIWMVPICLIFFVPWAGWLSAEVIKMGVRLERIPHLDVDLAALTKELNILKVKVESIENRL